MTRKIKLVAVTVVFYLLGVGTSSVIAQGNLTLEGLAEQLTGLTGRVDGIDERLSALEAESIPAAALSDLASAISKLAGFDDTEPVTLYLQEFAACIQADFDQGEESSDYSENEMVALSMYFLGVHSGISESDRSPLWYSANADSEVEDRMFSLVLDCGREANQ